MNPFPFLVLSCPNVNTASYVLQFVITFSFAITVTIDSAQQNSWIWAMISFYRNTIKKIYTVVSDM